MKWNGLAPSLLFVEDEFSANPASDDIIRWLLNGCSTCVFFSIWMFYALIMNCFKYITLLLMNLHLNWHTCLLYIAKLRFESSACFAAFHVITNKQNYREKKYKAFWLCFLHYIQCLAMCSVAFSRIQQSFSKCSMLWIGLLSWDWPQCTWQYTSITYK